MENFILIERYGPASFFWPNLLKHNNIPEFSIEDLLVKYQGFEGDLLSFLYVDIDKIEIRKIKQCFESKNLNNRFLFYLVPENNRALNSLKELANFVGYDVGICEQEKTIYSSIFNEVIFGRLNELVSWKNSLNENLLFPDKTTAENYVKFHVELAAQGKDVEDYEEMLIYEMWKL